jgi:DNA-binding transcriptional ArsR family regulator
MPELTVLRPAPTIALDTLVNVLGSTTRWTILRELADGTSLMVCELAERTGNESSIISKHLTFMRKAGIIINPRIRLFEIAPQFLSDPAEKLLDFGWCTLRLGSGLTTA